MGPSGWSGLPRAHPKRLRNHCDHIFNPDTGAGLRHIKVELGADNNTSSGAEPVTKRSADEPANVLRGAGFHFIADAGTLGLPEQGPFDRILVSAEARTLPPSLVAQLTDDGVLVAPVAGTMIRVHRAAGGDVTTTHGAYLFVPLIED